MSIGDDASASGSSSCFNIMAANRAMRSDPEFSVAVAELQPALAAWRQKRKHRDPIPEPLWQTLVRLARSHGVSPVAQAFRLNYTTLRHRILVNSLARNDANQFLNFGN